MRVYYIDQKNKQINKIVINDVKNYFEYPGPGQIGIHLYISQDVSVHYHYNTIIIMEFGKKKLNIDNHFIILFRRRRRGGGGHVRNKREHTKNKKKIITRTQHSLYDDEEEKKIEGT